MNVFIRRLKVIVLCFSALSSVAVFAAKKVQPRRVIAKALIAKHKVIKKKLGKKNKYNKKLSILRFVLRRFGTNPAAAALRPPISQPLRRF